jgi:hypothetical protein
MWRRAMNVSGCPAHALLLFKEGEVLVTCWDGCRCWGLERLHWHVVAVSHELNAALGEGCGRKLHVCGPGEIKVASRGQALGFPGEAPHPRATEYIRRLLVWAV